MLTVSNFSIQQVTNLTRLVELKIGSSFKDVRKIEDFGILQRLSSLRKLVLKRLIVNGEMIQILSTLHHIPTIKLKESNFNFQDSSEISDLSKLTNLKTLDINFSQTHREIYPFIPPLTNLEHLEAIGRNGII